MCEKCQCDTLCETERMQSNMPDLAQAFFPSWLVSLKTMSFLVKNLEFFFCEKLNLEY